MLHDKKTLAVDPRGAGIRVVIAGHSHRPSIQEKNHVMHINPGSAGPRRFRLPVSIAYLDIDGDVTTPRIHMLEV